MGHKSERKEKKEKKKSKDKSGAKASPAQKSGAMKADETPAVSGDIAAFLEQHHIAVADKERSEPALFQRFENADGINSGIRAHCLSKFSSPTPIQAASWPVLLAGRDIYGIAKTGSGKTLAFLAPYFSMRVARKYEHATRNKDPNAVAAPTCVCMAPTRELAMQIQQVAEEFAGTVELGAFAAGECKSVAVVGGVSKRDQKAALWGADCVVATPGRLHDFADEGTIDLSCVQFLALDEGDRMLDLGFIDEIRRIVAMMPTAGRQTVLFSATWPLEVSKLANSLRGKDHSVVMVTVGKKQADDDGSNLGQLRANEKIKQRVVVMDSNRSKWDNLMRELRAMPNGSKVIVFALYKNEAAELDQWLKGDPVCRHCTVMALHGNQSQDERTRAIETFRKPTPPGTKMQLLVATDVASRGLDVDDVNLVVNYTFPLTIEDYVHRIGRTGRAGKKGEAVTFFNTAGNHKEKEKAFELARVMQQSEQEAPKDLLALSESTFCATKKKSHPVYGNHFKSDEEMQELEAKKVRVVFSDSDSD